jgi:predicted nucleic acid-binding protein
MASLPPNTQLRACAITLGEIEAGHRMTRTTNQQRRDDYTTFVNEKFLPNSLPISHTTRLSYAEIIARIWQRHPPANSKIRTEAHLLQLGVDVNDVWVVSAAWEHGLILVTQDKMECIREAIPEVQIECWL